MKLLSAINTHLTRKDNESFRPLMVCVYFCPSAAFAILSPSYPSSNSTTPLCGPGCCCLCRVLLPFVDCKVDVLNLCLRFSLCDEEQGDDSSSAQEESQYLDYKFGVHRLSDFSPVFVLTKK